MFFNIKITIELSLSKIKPSGKSKIKIENHKRESQKRGVEI